LKKLINVQKQWERGYEEIEDILLNAERREVQNRFDDAVARLYRAVELLAQVRLKKQYKLDTSNLDMSKVPESVRKKIIPDDDGKVRIGQRWAYEILASMENEPVGTVYRNWERKLSDALTKRNSSILAHGNIPIDKTTYDEVSNTVNSFINEAFDVIKHKRQMKQFINKFEFLEM
jgi:CRISPR-associated protein (TIGR02710 family)